MRFGLYITYSENIDNELSYKIIQATVLSFELFNLVKIIPCFK